MVTLEDKQWYTIIWNTIANNTGIISGTHMAYLETTPSKFQKDLDAIVKGKDLISSQVQFVFQGKLENIVSHAI